MIKMANRHPGNHQLQNSITKTVDLIGVITMKHYLSRPHFLLQAFSKIENLPRLSFTEVMDGNEILTSSQPQQQQVASKSSLTILIVP